MAPPVPPMSWASSYPNERTCASFISAASQTQLQTPQSAALELSYCSFPAMPRMEVTQLGQGNPPDFSWLSRATNQSPREIPRLGNPPWFFSRPGQREEVCLLCLPLL